MVVRPTPRTLAVPILLAATLGLPIAAVSGQGDGSAPRLEVASKPPSVSVSGESQPTLSGVERVFIDFMARNKIPGGSLAIACKGRLVYDRGFGFAKLETAKAGPVPVVPESRFRIASVSKPFTAVAILQLVRSGKLRLRDRVYELLRPVPLEGQQVSDEFKQVTILHLLQHRGGWSRDASFDPMFRSHLVAAAVGRQGPAEPEDIIRYMAGRKLEFAPGSGYQYSNFGYCLLGRVIEKVSGQSYGDYVKQRILAPLGIESMALGRSAADRRLAGEVRYYGQDWRLARSVFAPKQGLTVPWPYGGFYLEAMDSHGAWVAKASDLLRFACDFDDPEHSRLLDKASILTMFKRPPGHAGKPKHGRPRPRFYACGWTIQVNGRVRTQGHGGSLPGTTTKLLRRSDGIHWVVLFNSRRDAAGKRIHPDQIQGRIQQALNRVEVWPEVDLFKR